MNLVALLQVAMALAVSVGHPRESSVSFDVEAVSPSFMDSLFGELVASEQTMAHKQQLLRKGEVREMSTEGLGLDQSGQLLEQTQYGAFDVTLNSLERSHEAYMKYRLKLNLPSDDETSDLSSTRNLFGGIVTFAAFPHFDCFDPKHYDNDIDIAILGAPFDTGTSYRPGARMGPEALRSGARRLGHGRTPVRGRRGSKLSLVDPYNTTSHGLSIVDCGDVPMTPFDNRIALNQLYRGERAIGKHPAKNSAPRVLTLGGDHTITLMAIKAAYDHFGPLAVLHFDSHIDTWDPKVLGGGISSYEGLNHGTFLHYAAEQGFLAKGHCSHVGLRAPYISRGDPQHDKDCGFHAITATDIDEFGREGIVQRLRDLVGDRPVYISVDIDVLDPSTAPGTGTMEIGGWTTRELIGVLEGLEGINLVGGDVVEVSPPYDTNSEITSLAGTGVIDLLLGLMVVNLTD